MRPDVKALLKNATRSRIDYPVARAGWNGPEDKMANDSSNPLYDQLRKQASVAELAHQLAQVAIPDWRIFLLFAGIIALTRMLLSTARRFRYSNLDSNFDSSLARPNVLDFPSASETDMAVSAGASERAA